MKLQMNTEEIFEVIKENLDRFEFVDLVKKLLDDEKFGDDLRCEWIASAAISKMDDLLSLKNIEGQACGALRAKYEQCIKDHKMHISYITGQFYNMKAQLEKATEAAKNQNNQ